jgi:flavin reductase (DIM6/NTAB) family NADH-FMN oxidoreductase RutF
VPTKTYARYDSSNTMNIKDAMSCFCTGVTVITTHHQGQDWGMTCNSFNTVSLDPAMVLWSIRTASSSRQAFASAKGYTVNILSGDQQHLAMQFTRGTQTERFAGLDLVRLADHRPRIAGALAWFDCALDKAVPAGDHDIMLGKVLSFGMNTDLTLQPLYYAKHKFGSIPIDKPYPEDTTLSLAK